MPEAPDWGLASWLFLDMVTGLWCTHDPNFCSLSIFLRFKEHTCHLSPHLGLRWMLEVPHLGLVSWSWFGYGLWSLVFDTPICLILALYLGFEGSKRSMSCKSSFESLEGTWGSWLGICILILIWIWSLVFHTPMIRIWAFNLDFEGAKNSHVLEVLIWGFDGDLRFLTGDLHLDPDLIWTLVFYTPIFLFLALYFHFEGAKSIHIH